MEMSELFFMALVSIKTYERKSLKLKRRKN